MALVSRIFNPVMGGGMVYMRAVGDGAPMQFVGGVEKLELAINDEKKKQQSFDRAGGGTRSQVVRIKDVMLKADLQDLNAVNMARAVFGTTTAVLAGTVVGEAAKAYKGGLTRLKNLNPTSVVVKKGAATVVAATNYEVRPEGLYILENAATLLDGDAITVDYAFGGYDVIEAITSAAPMVEISFAGVNEAMNSAASVVDIYRCQLGAAKGIGLIDDTYAKLAIEGEVLMDSTKTGAGTSRFFRVQMA